MSEIQKGYCQCGCGEETSLSPITDHSRGYVAGEPRSFVLGHNRRKSPVEYIVDPETGCWVWQKARNHKGYGMAVRGKPARTSAAHRVYYEEHVGPIPNGLQIDHLCRNRPCVNPEHLEAVTGTENQRRGATAKLNLEKAREVRSLYSQGWDHGDIAEAFGISRSNVAMVGLGKTWKEGVV